MCVSTNISIFSLVVYLIVKEIIQWFFYNSSES